MARADRKIVRYAMMVFIAALAGLEGCTTLDGLGVLDDDADNVTDDATNDDAVTDDGDESPTTDEGSDADPVISLPFAVVDTGQDMCYDDSVGITCPVDLPRASGGEHPSTPRR